MTERDNTGPHDKELSNLVDRAVGDLVPTTEADVARAEADGCEHEGELPEALLTYREPEPESGRSEARIRSNVVPLFSHTFALLAGAAAAVVFARATTAPPVLRAGGDPLVSAKRAPSAEAPPIRLGSAAGCGPDCCAGSACSSAPAEMKSCPSGRDCVACAKAELDTSQYRIKLGGFAPSELGKRALAAGLLEVCAQVASSALVCAPSYASANGQGQWVELPLVATVGEALSGVTIQIRSVGTKQPLAEWSQVLAVSPTMLCKGVLLEPRTKSGEAFGALSLFLVDTRYVELGRASDVATLRLLRRRFETGLTLKIFETRKTGDDRFALVAGPFSAAQASRVRWTVLEAGGAAEDVVGIDFKGEPQSLE